MKINKETRQRSRELLRASFVNGVIDRSRVESIVVAITKEKPRNYLKLLQTYQRLLRLELDKRARRLNLPAASKKLSAAKSSPALRKNTGLA